MTKKRNIGMLVLDILIVLGFVILFDRSAFGGLAFHEIAGLCICGAIIAHIIINRKRIGGFTKEFGSVPVKTKIEYILALLLLIDLGVMAVTGILISKVVFANVFSGQVNARSLHVASSYLALMLMGLHIGLVWDKVCAMTRDISGIKETPKSVGAVFTAVAVLIFAAGIYNVSTTHYFGKAFSFTGGGEQYRMLPDSNNGPFGQNDQTDQNAQNDQTGQSSTTDSGTVSPNTTAAATASYTAVGMTSSASGQQGSSSSGSTNESDSGNSSGVTGGGSGNSNSAPSFAGGRGGGKGKGGGMPHGGSGGYGSGNAPTGRGDAQFGNGEGFGQMRGERGVGTAATATENLSILGMFAVMAYYLAKLLQKKRSKPVEVSGGMGDEPERVLAQAALEDTASAETIAEVEEPKSEPVDNAAAADPEPEEK